MPFNGDMVNVNGSSTATAMPEDNPGVAPTTMPSAVPKIISRMVSKVMAASSPACRLLSRSMIFQSVASAWVTGQSRKRRLEGAGRECF